MTETKNTNTYTELEIARALTHMTDSKKDLLCSTLKIGELKELASNKDKYTDYLSNAENYAKMYALFADALKEFHKKLIGPQSVDSWINDVACEYRGLSTQDKVKFNREITANGNLETSLEIFKESWGKLIGDITGGK